MRAYSSTSFKSLAPTPSGSLQASQPLALAALHPRRAGARSSFSTLTMLTSLGRVRVFSLHFEAVGKGAAAREVQASPSHIRIHIHADAPILGPRKARVLDALVPKVVLAVLGLVLSVRSPSSAGRQFRSVRHALFVTPATSATCTNSAVVLILIVTSTRGMRMRMDLVGNPVQIHHLVISLSIT